MNPRNNRNRRSRAGVAVLAVALAVLPWAAASSAAGDGMSYELRQELKAALATHASKIHDVAGGADAAVRRATYSTRFHPTDDGAYEVAFSVDIAGDERLTTERYRVRLARGASGAWEVADQTLEDTYRRMVRATPGDETFQRFTGARLVREGLAVRATNGTLWVDSIAGEPRRIVFSSDDLTYSYEPPPDLSHHQARVYQHLRERHPEDFEFQPEIVAIDCDPASCREFLERSFFGLSEISKEALHDGAEKQYRKMWKEQTDDREENPFSSFELPLDEGRTLYGVGVKRTGKDQWIALRYDSDQPWEVTFLASEYGPLYGYISDESRRAGVRPYDVELRDDATAKDFELEALKGTVELALEDSEVMDADVTFTMNFKRERREIPFSLISFRGFGGSEIPGRDPALTINTLQTGDGQDLTWFLSGPAKGYVIFPEPVAAGTKLELRMAFRSRGSILKFTPTYSYMDRGGWLPFVRFTDRIDEFELTVRAPSRYSVLGIGTKASESTEGEVTTTHWKAESPVAFPTIIFGDYYSVQPRIKATKLDGTEIPVTVYADKHGMAEREIRGKQLQTLGEQAVNSLNLYRELYGVDYPYGKLDLVNDPLGLLGPLYGQAPASLIFIGWAAFRGEGQLGSLTGEAAITRALRSLVSHEVGHQWWAHVISNANMRNYWFIESFTEYASALYIEAINSDGGKDPEKGYEAYMKKVDDWRRTVLETDLVTSVQDSSALYGGEDGFVSYVAAVYNKGPYALHVLRMTFGPEKIYQLLRDLMVEFADREIVARDIQRVAERTYGGNMDWFFDQWFRGIGIPEYAFQYAWRKAEDRNFVVEGEIRQRVVFGKKKEPLDGVYFRGVVPVTVLGRDRQEYTVPVLVEGPTTAFAFKVPVEPREVSLNKHGEILAHDVLENREF